MANALDADVPATDAPATKPKVDSESVSQQKEAERKEGLVDHDFEQAVAHAMPVADAGGEHGEEAEAEVVEGAEALSVEEAEEGGEKAGAEDAMEQQQQQEEEEERWHQQLQQPATTTASESAQPQPVTTIDAHRHGHGPSPEVQSPPNRGTWDGLVTSVSSSHNRSADETIKNSLESSSPNASRLSLHVGSSPDLELPNVANARKQIALDMTSLARATRFAAELAGPPLSLVASSSAPVLATVAAKERSPRGQSSLVLPRIVKPGRRPSTLRAGVDEERNTRSTLEMPSAQIPVLQTSSLASASPMKRPSSPTTHEAIWRSPMSPTRRPEQNLPRRLSVAEVRRVLVQLQWLQGINKRELHLLSTKMSVNQHSIPKFHVVFNECMPGDRIYVVANGAVRLTGSNPKHSRDVNAIGSFGESVVIKPADRSATAVALLPSLLLSLSYSELHDVQSHCFTRSRTFEVAATSISTATPDVHLALVGTVAAMLRRSKLLAESLVEDTAAEGAGPLEDFTEVRRSVRQNASIIDFARRQSVQLEAPDALKQLQSKFDRKTQGGPMPIVSSNLSPHNPVVDSTPDHSLVNPRPNVGDALSASDYVAAGRVNLLGASALWREGPDGHKYLALVRPAPREEGLDEAESSIAPPPPEYGRIYGRPPGTPPKHLLGVRAREARLGSREVADAQANADALQTKIDAEIDAKIDKVIRKYQGRSPDKVVSAEDLLAQLPNGAVGTVSKYAQMWGMPQW